MAAFGVGLGYLLAEFGSTLKKNVVVGINPSLSSFILVCLVLSVLWLHKCKFLWAMLVAVVPLFLLEIDRFLQHLDSDLGQFW